MEMKYKIGEEVIINQDLETNDLYGDIGVDDGMLDYQGKTAIISSAFENSESVLGYAYSLDIDDGQWFWTAQMFNDNLPIKTRGFETVVNNHKKHKDNSVINMPLRATKTSAGYDFYTPIDISIKPQDKVLIWTDIKAYMQQGEFLMLDVTSGIGTKKDCMLANTIGIADADYYSCESNDGNLGICLRNLKPQFELDGYMVIEANAWNKSSGRGLMEEGIQVQIPKIIDLTEKNTVVFKAGEKIAQGIFVKYETSDNCNGEETRKGGFGSTDKK